MTDRELDALVAEKVIGRTFPSGTIVGDPVAKCVPHYSTDISAAWQVVEEMRDNGWNFVIGVFEKGAAALFCRGAAAMADATYVDIASRAICLAALEALSVGIDRVT